MRQARGVRPSASGPQRHMRGDLPQQLRDRFNVVARRDSDRRSVAAVFQRDDGIAGFGKAGGIDRVHRSHPCCREPLPGDLLDKLVDRLFLPVDQRDPPLFAEQFEEGIDSHRLRRILLIDEKALAQPPPRAGERPAGQSMVQLGELPLPQRGSWTRLRRGDIGQDLLGPGHQRGQEFFLPDGQLVGLASPFEMVQHDDGLAAEREADPEPGMQQRPTRHSAKRPVSCAFNDFPTGQWPIRASTRRA
ncbi:hypothetical protein WR25_08703 [Diploscapter pachys]|uniref:Uncharacterized protein n=1 Tax=Diploscapter pachys TaxID=2018661 RepID=A0A2A2K2C2_9BILA|nr:hypothetical protein WR25_08703 [Diploscapter pachys]